MTSKVKALTVVALLALLAITAAMSFAFYYRGNAIDYKSQRDEAKGKLNQAYDTITDMHARQQDVAALDAKYTKELANAQAIIDQLERDVASGKRRLQLNATCTKQSGTASLDDGASPGLTDSAERDYFTLRKRIEVAGKQIAGLQQYIREQCLN